MKVSLNVRNQALERSEQTSSRKGSSTESKSQASSPAGPPIDSPSPVRETAELPKDSSEVGGSARTISASELHQQTVDEQYDYLKEVVLEMSGEAEDAWKAGPNEVNIIGIRNLSDGRVNEPVGNAYDDTIYAVWVDEQGQRHVEAFNASTDAGVRSQNSRFGYRHEDGTMAYSHVADGFYQDAFAKSGIPAASNHNGTFNRGLAQVGDLYIHSDYNNDGVIQKHERLGEDRNGDGFGDGVKVGPSWGIYFHPGGMSKDGQVNSWSAGCQVIVGSQYQRFQEIINGASNNNFSYTLVDGRDLEGPGPLSATATVAPPSVAHQTFSTPPQAPNYSTGLPSFLGEDHHSQYGSDFQVVNHGSSLPDASGREIVIGLHADPPVSVNYRPVQLSQEDRGIEETINGFLAQENALGVDWSQGPPLVRDLAGREVTVGEAIIQAGRANDVDPLQLTAILLQTQQGQQDFVRWTSPLFNQVLSTPGNGPQTTGEPGLDYAFGLPRPEWEGFTNQAYLAAGNFRTKAAHGNGTWWKGARELSPEQHFHGAQAARYIQEHGDGFAAGATDTYNRLLSAHRTLHGSEYASQYQTFGPDQRPQYAPGGPVLRRVADQGTGLSHSRGNSAPSYVAEPQRLGDEQPMSLEDYVQEICRYILNFDGPRELLISKAQELILLCTLANLLQTPVSQTGERLIEQSLEKVFRGDQQSMAGAILSMVA